jgi:hypothetical protein
MRSSRNVIEALSLDCHGTAQLPSAHNSRIGNGATPPVR